MANKITTYDVWVGNLPLSADEKNVGKIFSKYGETYSMFIKPSNKGDYKFGFVKYYSESDADSAVNELNGQEFDGKAIQVKRDFKQMGTKDGEENKEKPRNKRNLQKPPQKKPADMDKLHTLLNSLTVMGEGGPNPGPFAASDGISNMRPQENRKEREKEQALITHVESPVAVWLQTVTDENQERMLNITEQLASVCPAASQVTGMVQPGKIYATMFSEDQMWYRCQMKQSLGTDTIKVQYIDYGNTEEVKKDSLVEIPQSLAAMKPMATKLILQNLIANDLSDQKAIDWLKALTDGILIDAAKLFPLKDNTGHYGMLYVGNICINDQVREQGFAYLRPVMNSTKANDIGLQNKVPPLKPLMSDMIIGSGGGYADSGGGGFGDGLGNPMFGGQRQPKFQSRGLVENSDSSAVEVEKLRQELAKKNILLQQAIKAKNMNDMNQDHMKQLQNQLTRNKRDLDKAKADLSRKSLMIEQLQSQKADFEQVTDLCNKVRNLRVQFPTGQNGMLDDAISITLSKDRISSSSVSTLQPTVALLTSYRIVQKEIASFTDKAEIENMITARDKVKQDLYNKSDELIKEIKALSMDNRLEKIQALEQQLKQDYSPYFAFNVHNNPSLEDLVPSFNDWKVKKEVEFTQVRERTSAYEELVIQNMGHIGKLMKLETKDPISPLPISFEEMLSRYTQLLQQEILCTNLEQTSDASLIAAVIKAIMNELVNETKDIEHLKSLINEFTEIKAGIEPWLSVRPNTEELTQIKKTIRSLKSKLRHKEADRQDLEEAGESEEEELSEVKSEIKSIKSELHKALLSQENTLLSLAKATTEHFPELFCQFEDLGIKSLVAYNGLVTSGRDLDHYTLTHIPWKEGLSSTEFAGEQVYLQEYLVGDIDHLDKEMFIKNVSRFKEVSCACPQLPHIQNLFFVKNERLGYVQIEFQQVECLLEIVKGQLDIQLRQKIIENLSKAVLCLHEGHIIHGEISPNNIGYTPDGQVVLLCPDLSKMVENRIKKPYVSENGLHFSCPEVACGRSSGTKSTDMYCLGLVVLWLYFPSLPIPVKADGYPRLTDLQMDPQISKLLYNLLCNPECRFKASQVLSCEYFKADMSLPSDSSTEESCSVSTSVCSVVENPNSLPQCDEIITPQDQDFTEEQFSSMNGDGQGENHHPVEEHFPEISQFNPSDYGQEISGEGIFANSAEMLANCLSQLPPLSEMPGLPESDDHDLSDSYKPPASDDHDLSDSNKPLDSDGQDFSDSYKPSATKDESEDVTEGNISPPPEEVENGGIGEGEAANGNDE